MFGYIVFLVHCSQLTVPRVIVVDRSAPNNYFNISITVLELKDDQAYMAWSTSGGQTPDEFSVNISQFDRNSQTLLQIKNISLDRDLTEAYFCDLNDTRTYQYQFCIIASLPDGTTAYTCRFPTTTTDLPVPDDSCISVTERISSSREFSLNGVFPYSFVLAPSVFVCWTLWLYVRNGLWEELVTQS